MKLLEINIKSLKELSIFLNDLKASNVKILSYFLSTLTQLEKLHLDLPMIITRNQDLLGSILTLNNLQNLTLKNLFENEYFEEFEVIGDFIDGVSNLYNLKFFNEGQKTPAKFLFKLIKRIKNIKLVIYGRDLELLPKLVGYPDVELEIIYNFDFLSTTYKLKYLCLFEELKRIKMKTLKLKSDYAFPGSLEDEDKFLSHLFEVLGHVTESFYLNLMNYCVEINFKRKEFVTLIVGSDIRYGVISKFLEKIANKYYSSRFINLILTGNESTLDILNDIFIQKNILRLSLSNLKVDQLNEYRYLNKLKYFNINHTQFATLRSLNYQKHNFSLSVSNSRKQFEIPPRILQNILQNCNLLFITYVSNDDDNLNIYSKNKKII